MKLYIASDHAGFELKEYLKKNFSEVTWDDLGPSSKERVDYPDFAKTLGERVSKDNCLGVLICGSGIGMSISANKIKGIRAAVVESESAARLSRQHNNANVLCMGARILAPEYAMEVLKAWLNSNFEGGRHENRVKKITALEA